MAYKKHATGEGVTFREQKNTRGSCTEFGVKVVASYIKKIIAQSHVICVPQKRRVDEAVGGTTTYVFSFPRVLQEVKFTVPGCPSAAHSVRRTQ